MCLISQNIFFTTVKDQCKCKTCGKIDIDAANEYLIVATTSGDIEKVRMLLSYGANANAKTPEGYTVLYVAAQKGYSEIVSQLLANGANVNESLLAQIAKIGSDPSIRCAVVKKLSDQEVLARVAVTDIDADVRRAAVKNLTDNEKDGIVRTNALKSLVKLGDPGIKQLIQAVLESEPMERWCQEIIDTLPTEALVEVINRHPNTRVRRFAVGQLRYDRGYGGKNIPALRNILENEKNEEVRAAAADELLDNNPDFYIKMLSNDSNPVIRFYVANKIPASGFDDILNRLYGDVDTKVSQRAKEKMEMREAIALRFKRFNDEHPLLGRLESASISDMAELLIRLLDSASRNGWVGPDANEAKACCLIGEELARRGSTSLMRQVATKELGRFNNCRSLDMWWDGIGGWRG